MRELTNDEIAAVGGGDIPQIGQCREVSIVDGIKNYVGFVVYALTKMFGA